jgi:hypothetical protein
MQYNSSDVFMPNREHRGHCMVRKSITHNNTRVSEEREAIANPNGS